MCRPPPIIHRRMELWSGSTAELRMRSAPAQPTRIGTPTYHGSCWASGQPGEETQISLLQMQFLEPSQSCQASTSLHQNRRRLHSYGTCRRPSTTGHRRRQTTTAALVRSHCRKSFSSPDSSWFAAMERSRRSLLCTTVHTWFWRDPYVFSKFRWEPGKTPCQLFA